MKNEFLVKNLPNKKDLTVDYKPLIRLVISLCFPDSAAELVHTMNTQFKSAQDSVSNYFEDHYLSVDHSNEAFDLLKKMKENKNQKGPLCMNIIR